MNSIEKSAENSNGVNVDGAKVSSGVRATEGAEADGHYIVKCLGPREEVRELYCALRDKVTALLAATKVGIDDEIANLRAQMEAMLEPKWTDEIHNVVCTDGKNAAFQAIFKSSAFTSTVYMGLIGNVTYTAPVVGNTAAQINTAASANNWNEAAAATCAARAAPSFAVPTAGAIALSTPRTFSMLATDTINGCFVLITSVALVAPAATVANTAGALWSAGAFTGGAKAVANGDTLNVTYSSSM